MGLAADHQGDRQPERAVLVADLDPGQIERIEDELDLAGDQCGVDLVAVGVQRHRRGLGDRPLRRPEERLAQQGRGRQRWRAGGIEALERRLLGLGVHAAVIDDLKPRREQTVELDELNAVVDLDQKLVADGPEESFDLALRRGRSGACVDQPDAEHRACAQQLRGHERRAAVDEDRVRDPARHQPRAQRGLQPEHVLAGAPAPADQQPRVVIDERQQHRPPRRGASQERAVQAVAGPQLVTTRRFEAAIDLPRRAAVRADVQPLAREMRLQRPQPRSASAGGEHDLPHLRRRALRPLPLELERQLQQLGARARRHHPRPRDQRLKPAAAIVTDPLIQRAARDPQRPPVGPDMLTLAQRADQPAALGLAQRRIGRVADQRVAEQPDLAATLLTTFSQRSRSRARDRPSSAHGREGAARVAKQRASRQHADDPPQITRPEPQHPRPRRDRDRLQRVRDAAPGRQHRPRFRIQRDRAACEVRPDQFGALREPPQPATHRARRAPPTAPRSVDAPPRQHAP